MFLAPGITAMAKYLFLLIFLFLIYLANSDKYVTIDYSNNEVNSR